MRAMNWIAAMLAGAAIIVASPTCAEEPTPLVLETKIPLGSVSGRIDHFAVDSARQRLFVAELGNNSVGVIDLKQRKLLRTIGGLKEPQGAAYEPASDTLYVANAGDGSVHLFQGENLSAVGRIELGDDADNIRVDTQANKVFVGYGSGAIAVIDPLRRKKTADISLGAHPESFQLDSNGRIYVNVPNAGQIAVVDRAAGKQSAAWSFNDARDNFAMALDENEGRVIVLFRKPALIVAFGSKDGQVIFKGETCGDADDVFVDPKRHRIYVSCGAGLIDVLQRRGAGYERVAQVSTAPGARTALFVPDADRLYVGVRGSSAESAAVWVLRPTP
jgi:YVTN family beta-propeller protein